MEFGCLRVTNVLKVVAGPQNSKAAGSSVFDGRFDMERKLAWLVMFLIPMPVFLSPSSSIILASGSIYNDALAFPLSFFLTPFIVLYGVKNLANVKGLGSVALVLLAIFSIWVVLLSFASAATNSPVSLIYAAQWLLLLFWGNYFFSSLYGYNLGGLMRPFFWGAFVGAAYILISGLLEIVFYGALLDSGRMSQNLVFKGQYQLYVYTPTLLAVSFLVVLTLYKSGILLLSKFCFFSYFLALFFALLFTGAREGLLVFLLGGFLICFIRSALSMLLVLMAFGLIFSGIYIYSDSIFQYFASSDLRLLNKFARLREAGDSLGARDVMIASYWGLIERDYMLGFGLLPPELAYPDAGVDVKSAHNFYVDVWAWTGLPGFALMTYFAVFLVCISAGNILKSFLGVRSSHAVRGFSWIVLLVLFVSNNINVPLRQPLIVPLFMLCVFLMIYLARFPVVRVSKE